MRAYILAAAVAVTSTVGADAPVTRNPDGSVTISAERLETLQKEFEQIANARERAAFEAGVNHQKQACASLI